MELDWVVTYKAGLRTGIEMADRSFLKYISVGFKSWFSNA